MRTDNLIIIVTWFGKWSKVYMDKLQRIKKYYMGDTINGIPKYMWNFKMWFRMYFPIKPK